MGAVQLSHLSLLNNMHLFLLLKWCDMNLPSWVPAFLKTGSWHCPKLFSTLSLLVLVAVASHGHHTIAWVSGGNRLAGSLPFLFFLQLNPNYFLAARHCCWSKGTRSQRWEASLKGDDSLGPISHGKWVSLVDRRGVVRCVHKTCGSSSTHLSFASSNLFFSALTMTLLTVSTCPFP